MIRSATAALAALLFAALPAAAADYAKPGPFEIDNWDAGPCTIFAPLQLGEGGRKHPVILWGNGTGAQPVSYVAILRHWASHGFTVIAAKTGQAGSGREMLDCLNRAQAAAKTAEARTAYAQRADFSKVGASGHSQGAWGALRTLTDPRIAATAPIQPGGSSMARADPNAKPSPMFLISGSADNVAPPRTQSLIFGVTDAPAFWGTLEGAGHFSPIQDPRRFLEPTTAWFAWKLQGDQEAGKMFVGEACGLCRAREWRIERRNGG